MSTSNIIIAHPVSEDKLESLKAFLKALKIKFEVANEDTYNEDFVKMIQKSEQEFKKGQFTRVKKNELSDFLGLK
jgi:methyl coenzyme M reductase alpha subunit